MADEEVVVQEEPTPAPFVATGVTFDGLHSYTNFGLWLMERPDTGSPEPKLNTVEVPGMDGYVDLTEANAGEVKFANRQMVFTFGAMVGISDQAAFKATIANALHGKKIQQIVLDEDPGWYYTGRATVQFEDVINWKLRCIVTVDAAPYAMKATETVVNLNDSQHTQEEYWVTLASNTSEQSWNSNFMLGTKQFPAGVAFYSNASRLKISWANASDVQYGAPEVYVSTPAHTLRHIVTSAEKAQKYVSFSASDLSDANIDASQIYRVLATGISNCSLTVSQYSTKYVVQNGRKTVAPVFDLDATGSVTITVDGQAFSIPVGISQNADIVFKSGDTEIYVKGDATVTSFTVTFREGKL